MKNNTEFFYGSRIEANENVKKLFGRTLKSIAAKYYELVIKGSSKNQTYTYELRADSKTSKIFYNRDIIRSKLITRKGDPKDSTDAGYCVFITWDTPGRFSSNTPGTGGSGDSFVRTAVYNFIADLAAVMSDDEKWIKEWNPSASSRVRGDPDKTSSPGLQLAGVETFSSSCFCRA